MEQDLCYGKTFQELFPQTKEMTLPTFLEQWCKGMFLSLEMDGRTQESVFPKTEDESWNGVCLTHNTSEYRKDAVESSLYSILEHGGGVLRYCLSPKACQGILRRAEERDKTLPKTLKETLERMASMQNGGGYKLVGSLCADDRKGAGNQYVDQGKVVMEKKDTMAFTCEPQMAISKNVMPTIRQRDYKDPNSVLYVETKTYDMKNHHNPQESDTVSMVA